MTRVSMKKLHQRGAALIFGLVVLLVLTILGIAGLRTSAIQQLMAGNLQEATRAFTAAESAMDAVLADVGTFYVAAPTTYDYNFTGTLNGQDIEPLRSHAIAYSPIRLQRLNNMACRSAQGYGTDTGCAFLDQVVIGRTGTALAPLVQDVRQQGVRQYIPNPMGKDTSDVDGKAPSES
jgi:Tfp pilus assembly protein PilV